MSFRKKKEKQSNLSIIEPYVYFMYYELEILGNSNVNGLTQIISKIVWVWYENVGPHQKQNFNGQHLL